MHTTATGPLAAAPRQATSGQQPKSPLNIVMVDDELPLPTMSGKRQRTLNLTLRLARRHKITFICHRGPDNAETQRARAWLLEQGIRTVVVDRAKPWYGRSWSKLLSPLPYAVTWSSSKALRRAVQQYAADHPVDLWHCEWTPCAEALKDVPQGPWVVMAHHLEAQLWQRQRDQESNSLRRWYLRKQLRKFLRFEFRAFNRATATITVSPDDAVLARYALGAPRVEIVDNGVDVDYFRPAPVPRQPETVLFLGNLDSMANLDAVGQLLEVVWPSVRTARPGATLQIVGHNPPAWLQRRAERTTGVELHASVPDVRPYLTTCSVLAVPQRVAGGTRLKILEALACETPVVSTTIGAEGLRLEAGEHLTVVDGTNAMASALLNVLEEPDQAQSQAWRGRQVVAENYSWDVLAERLEQVWLSCARCQQVKVAA
jgi:glycosyltransferase involved in cell wall biosynthesis